MDDTTETAPASYAFILKLNDHPGGMEVIAATFAHRGVSLACSLGNDGALDPEGRATVLVTFSATPAKKEVLRRALSRLWRVRSLVEHPIHSPNLRKTAVFRVADDRFAKDGTAMNLERVSRDEATGETTYLLVAAPATVDAFLQGLKKNGSLRDVTTTVIGL